MPTQLRVACVQLESDNGQVEANLARATPLVIEAATRGAKLILCPEFLAAGYIYDESIWESGEPQGGPTESWLIQQASANDAYVGASYLEADGEDFWNTFSLAGPDGTIVGRVRKESLPAFEGWYFKSCDKPKVMNTEIGRIAVGICQDNHTARFMRRLCNTDFDLIVMPHSSPCLPVRSFSRQMEENLTEIVPFYARAFGVPVLFVNKVGPGGSSPIPIVPGLRLRFDFRGHASIYDGDGSMCEQLGNAPGVAVANVTLDPARKKRPTPVRGYWSRKPTSLGWIGGATFTALEWVAKRVYARNPRRRQAALRIGREAAGFPETK